MNQIDLAFAPALEQAQLIRRREVSPLELVELYLERIQRLDSKLGSYFTVATEQAIADATAKTEQLAQTNDTSNSHHFLAYLFPSKTSTQLKAFAAPTGRAC
jgi:amidase